MIDFQQLTAREIMHPDPLCARPDESLAELSRRLVETRINGAPVVNDQGRLLGVVSRSDVIRVSVLYETLDRQVTDRLEPPDIHSEDFTNSLRETFHGFSDRLSKLTVRDVMRTQTIFCTPETTIAAVARQMIEEHIHRIVVVENNKPLGMISSLDIVRLVAAGDKT